MINIKRTPKTRPLKSHLIELLIIFTICIIAITIYSTYDYKKLQTSMIEDNNRLYATQLAKNTRQVYETYENICFQAEGFSIFSGFQDCVIQFAVPIDKFTFRGCGKEDRRFVFCIFRHAVFKETADVYGHIL